MHNNLKRTLLFTHAGCLDGSAAAILFRHAGGDKTNIRFVPAGYVDDALQDNNSFMSTSRFVLCVDVAPSTEQVARYIQARENTYVIDHHASAAKWANTPGFVIDVNNSACGSELFRRWLVYHGHKKFEHEAWIRFTKLIDDHDRWQQNYPFSMEMPKFFSFVGQTEFIDRFMNVESRFKEEKDSYWDKFEKDMMFLISREQDRRFTVLMDRFTVVDREHNGKKFKMGYVVSSEINCSELLNTYLIQHPDIDVACQVNVDLNKISLRSNDKVNMTEYSGRYGGGGHKNAAGHPLPDNLVASIAGLIHG